MIQTIINLLVLFALMLVIYQSVRHHGIQNKKDAEALEEEETFYPGNYIADNFIQLKDITVYEWGVDSFSSKSITDKVTVDQIMNFSLQDHHVLIDLYDGNFLHLVFVAIDGLNLTPEQRLAVYLKLFEDAAHELNVEYRSLAYLGEESRILKEESHIVVASSTDPTAINTVNNVLNWILKYYAKEHAPVTTPHTEK